MLAVTNIAFWSFFIHFDMMAAGWATTSLHLLLIVAQMICVGALPARASAA